MCLLLCYDDQDPDGTCKTTASVIKDQFKFIRSASRSKRRRVNGK